MNKPGRRRRRRRLETVSRIYCTRNALQIASDTWTLFVKLPSVVHVNTQQSGKITVVGDLHGQLRDLIHIFRHNGMPSFDNPYLFNGDLVIEATTPSK